MKISNHHHKCKRDWSLLSQLLRYGTSPQAWPLLSFFRSKMIQARSCFQIQQGECSGRKNRGRGGRQRKVGTWMVPWIRPRLLARFLAGSPSMRDWAGWAQPILSAFVGRPLRREDRLSREGGRGKCGGERSSGRELALPYLFFLFFFLKSYSLFFGRFETLPLF